MAANVYLVGGALKKSGNGNKMEDLYFVRVQASFPVCEKI